MDDAFAEHYTLGVEQGRLMLNGEPNLELARTLELLRRFLPPAPAEILDVGGGPGVYASILARRGYRVHLVDILALHVEQASAAAAAQPEAPFTAALGDARRLGEREESWDAVLLLGPLYHLTERAQRLEALREARRVLRPQGVVVAAAIRLGEHVRPAAVAGEEQRPGRPRAARRVGDALVVVVDSVPDEDEELLAERLAAALG